MALLGSRRSLLGARTYTRGVSFDGTNDRFRTNAFSVSDGKVGTFSCWFWFRGGDAGFQDFVLVSTGGTTRFTVQKNTSNQIVLFGRTAAGVTILNVSTTSTFTSAMTGWNHLCVTWDMANTVRQIYVNGVAQGLTVTTFTNDTIDYTTPEFTVGADYGGTGQFVNGYVAQMFLDLSNATDFSVSANLAKFFSPNRTPVDLGYDGSRPTGTVPSLFLNGGPTEFGTNKGSGGALTAFGALDPVAQRVRV